MNARALLFNDRPLILLPGLATAIGLNEAIVLQQIHFLMQIKSGGRIIDGQKWVWNTHDKWQREHFPFFSLRTLRRAIESLEKSRLLRSCQPDGRKSRRKYYRIDYAALHADSRCGQIGQFNVAKLDSSFTETTSETTLTKESKETPFAALHGVEVVSPDIPAEWKPSAKRKMTKEQLLAKLPILKDYPSEDEFNDYLESQDHDGILSTRDLYLDLSRRKWHHWKADLHKWTKIRDWKKYVEALNDKMEGAKSG